MIKNQICRIKRNSKVIVMCQVALFSAIAYLLHFFRFQAFSFLSYDPKNLMVCISGIILTPLHSIIVSFVAAFLEMITTSDTGFYGFLMNFVASVFFSVPAALIYRIKRNKIMMLLGLITGTLALTGSMTALNLLITPLYLGSDVQTVVQLLPVAIVPFNLIKGVIDSSLIISLSGPILINMKRIGFFEDDEKIHTGKLQNILIGIMSFLFFALAITLIVLVYTGVIGG